MLYSNVVKSANGSACIFASGEMRCQLSAVYGILVRMKLLLSGKVKWLLWRIRL